MKKIRRTTVVMLTLLISFVFVPAALAHPLGNFTINQYVGLNISREMIGVDYVLDMAEIPAFQEIATFDENKNGKADYAEFAAYHADKCLSLLADLSLLLNNQPVNLTLTSSSIEFPAGVGGLSTLRLTCEYHAPLDSTGSNLELSFVNNAFPDRQRVAEFHHLINKLRQVLFEPSDEAAVRAEIGALGRAGRNHNHFMPERA